MVSAAAAPLGRHPRDPRRTRNPSASASASSSHGRDAPSPPPQPPPDKTTTPTRPSPISPTRRHHHHHHHHHHHGPQHEAPPRTSDKLYRRSLQYAAHRNPLARPRRLGEEAAPLQIHGQPASRRGRCPQTHRLGRHESLGGPSNGGQDSCGGRRIGKGESHDDDDDDDDEDHNKDHHHKKDHNHDHDNDDSNSTCSQDSNDTTGATMSEYPKENLPMPRAALRRQEDTHTEPFLQRRRTVRGGRQHPSSPRDQNRRDTLLSSCEEPTAHGMSPVGKAANSPEVDRTPTPWRHTRDLGASPVSPRTVATDRLGSPHYYQHQQMHMHHHQQQQQQQHQQHSMTPELPVSRSDFLLPGTQGVPRSSRRTTAACTVAPFLTELQRLLTGPCLARAMVESRPMHMEADLAHELLVEDAMEEEEEDAMDMHVLAAVTTQEDTEPLVRDSLLRMHQELVQLKQDLTGIRLRKRNKAAASPTTTGQKKSVHFASQLVTAIHHRPYTREEDIEKLFFVEEELNGYEHDRETTAPEQYETIATASRSQVQTVQVAYKARRRCSREAQDDDDSTVPWDT